MQRRPKQYNEKLFNHNHAYSFDLSYAPRPVRGLQYGAAADADSGDAEGRDGHDNEQLLK